MIAQFLVSIKNEFNVYILLIFKNNSFHFKNNSTDGLGHKDKYLDTSRKILSQEMLMFNMKALIFI